MFRSATTALLVSLIATFSLTIGSEAASTPTPPQV